MIHIISRHFITILLRERHFIFAILALVLSASRCFVFFFNRGCTSTRGSPSSIRRSSHRDLLGFSAAIRRRFEKKQTVKGGSTFAMYRLGIMAVGAFRALFQPLEGSFFVSPRAEERYTSPSCPSSLAPLLRRPAGEFVSLTQTEACPLDHFNAFLCFRLA